ncbi:MAG: HAMP domain-containing histidine kinase [Bacteroidales bacterium]|nr:HAMP domain-containing histidine kinase [Bacteroidales bacterium]
MDRKDEFSDSFIFSIVHDLKNMLVPIMFRAELLQLPALPEEKKEKTLQQLYDSCLTMRDALNSMVEICRNRSFVGEYKPVSFDLQLLVYEVMDVLKESYMRKQIRVENLVPGGTMVNADREAILSVLSNLMRNAIKFTPEKGRVKIFSEIRGQKVLFSIEDNGIGFDEEKMRALLAENKYYSTPGTQGERGTGFGLLLCISLLERGGISLECERVPGGGSRFSFALDFVS